MWHYSGALLHETAWPAGQELLQVIWQKYDDNVFNEKPISNAKVQGIEPSQPQSSKAVYVPPNIRWGGSTVIGSSQPERGPIPGLPVGYKVSQGQRKKERNTKRKETENTAKQGANANANSNTNEEGGGGGGGGGKARAQNTPASAQSNNKRNQQRTPWPSNFDQYSRSFSTLSNYPIKNCVWYYV